MRSFPLAALINREWRTTWADRGAYVLRSAYAGLLLLGAVAAWVVLPMAQGDRIEELPGLMRSTYGQFCRIEFIVVTLLASLTFARSVSREQERGSLDLLLLTPLTRLELLLGKLVGEFLGTTALLACGIPVLFLLLPLGGLTPAHILSAHLLLLAQVLLVGGFCVGLSAVFSRALPVMVSSWVLSIAMNSGPALWMQRQTWTSWGWWAWDEISFYERLDRQLDSVRPQFGSSLSALLIALLLGILACGLGSLVLERRLRRGTPVSLWVRLGRRLTRFADTPHGRRLFRPMTTLRHPLMRREFAVHRDLPFRIAWFLLAVGYMVGTWRLFNDSGSRNEDHVTFAAGGLAIGAGIAVLTGALAIGYDRLRGRLQLLISSGVSPEDIVRSRMAGLLMRMLYLVGVPAFHLAVVVSAAGWCEPRELAWRIPSALISLVLASQVMTVLTVQASLSIRRPEVAAVLAVLAALPAGAVVLVVAGSFLPAFSLFTPLVIGLILANYARCIRKLTGWVLG